MNVKTDKIQIAFLFFICLTLAASCAYAAEAKIGYVDPVRVFDNYNKTKEQDKILEKQTDEKKEEREKLVNEIRKMKDEIDILSAEAKEKKQAKVDEKIRGLQEYDQQTKVALTQQRDKAMREILKEIDDVIQKYAEENGYTLIINQRVLLYGKKQDDLTDKILQILNSKK